MPQTYDVFLSYASEDHKFANIVRHEIKTARLEIWPPENFSSTIPNLNQIKSSALENSEVVIVLLSPNAIDSDIVSKDIHYALSLKKRIIPLLVSGDGGLSVPYVIQGTQWIDGRNDLIKAIKELIQKIPKQRSDIKVFENPQQNSSARQVFLSYCHTDKALMQRVRNYLVEEGLSVWTDEEIEPGEPFWDLAIQKALGESRCMVIILTPNATSAGGLLNEIHWANKREKSEREKNKEFPVFPLLVKGDEQNAVPITLGNHKLIDARKDFQQGLDTVMRNACRYLNFESKALERERLEAVAAALREQEAEKRRREEAEKKRKEKIELDRIAQGKRDLEATHQESERQKLAKAQRKLSWLLHTLSWMPIFLLVLTSIGRHITIVFQITGGPLIISPIAMALIIVFEWIIIGTIDYSLPNDNKKFDNSSDRNYLSSFFMLLSLVLSILCVLMLISLIDQLFPLVDTPLEIAIFLVTVAISLIIPQGTLQGIGKKTELDRGLTFAGILSIGVISGACIGILGHIKTSGNWGDLLSIWGQVLCFIPCTVAYLGYGVFFMFREFTPNVIHSNLILSIRGRVAFLLTTVLVLISYSFISLLMYYSF